MRRNGGEQITSIVYGDNADDYFETKDFLWNCGMNPGGVYSSGEVDLKDVLKNPFFE